MGIALYARVFLSELMESFHSERVYFRKKKQIVLSRVFCAIEIGEKKKSNKKTSDFINVDNVKT